MASARLAPTTGLLVIALFGAPAPARAADDSYLPLGAGTRWEYEVHRDHTYRPTVGKIDRTFRRGTVVLEDVRALASDGDTLHELHERRDEKPVGNGLPPSREESRQFWSAEAAVLLHAVDRPGAASERFEPPLQMLPPLAEPGSRWKVGTWRTGEVAVPLEGEALGQEDVVDGDQRWDACLKVRYTGPVSGNVPVAGQQAKLRDGRVERIVWWKPGVGPVREVTTNDGELELPDGGGARIHEVVTVRLVRRIVAE